MNSGRVLIYFIEVRELGLSLGCKIRKERTNYICENEADLKVEEKKRPKLYYIGIEPWLTCLIEF